MKQSNIDLSSRAPKGAWRSRSLDCFAVFAARNDKALFKKVFGVVVLVLCLCATASAQETVSGGWSPSETGHVISQSVAVKAKSDCPGCFGTVTFSDRASGVRSDSSPKTGPVTPRTVYPAPPFPVSIPVAIVYPKKAIRKGWEGQTVVAAEVLPDGSVGRTALAKSSGHEVLDQAAEEAIQSWKFKSESEKDEPVPQYVDIPVTFKLQAED